MFTALTTLPDPVGSCISVGHAQAGVEVIQGLGPGIKSSLRGGCSTAFPPVFTRWTRSPAIWCGMNTPHSLHRAHPPLIVDPQHCQLSRSVGIPCLASDATAAIHPVQGFIHG